jgi:hypothetical protein
LPNDVFKATISNVSSGSLPAGSAVLHDERVISEEYYKYQTETPLEQVKVWLIL